MGRPVFFISDAHLGSSPQPEPDSTRLARLIPFLRSVRLRNAERLYILGDLFDFWFEYKHVMPWRHAPLLLEIRQLVESGTRVIFLGGNHDWWVGETFAQVAGMEVKFEAFAAEASGRRLFLSHGDGLSSASDSGYLILKRVLRHPWIIRVLRLVHPDWAYGLGHRLSKFSRDHLTQREFRVDPKLAQFIDQRLASGFDAVITGHLHTRHAETRAGGGRFFILGDWMTLFSALRLEGGEFFWEDWATGEGTSEPAHDGTRVGGHSAG